MRLYTVNEYIINFVCADANVSDVFTCLIFCQLFIKHGSGLETWRSHLCQDEGLPTLACKSESLPESKHTTNP